MSPTTNPALIDLRSRILDIQRTVGQYFNVTPEQMQGKARPNNIAWPRQIAMCLSMEIPGVSTQKVADEFGYRHRGAVIHAQRVVKDRCDIDGRVMELIDKLRQECQFINTKTNA